MMMIAIPSRCWRLVEQRQDLRLDGDVERRRRLVGDQQLRLVGERHRDHHALAHAAGELVRDTGRRAARGSGIPTSVEQLDRAVARGGLRDALRWARIASASWIADLVERMQRRQRVLEDHRDVVAADRAQLAIRAARTRSRPSNMIRPRRWRPVLRVSPIVVSDETVLPEPDSPTIPSVCPVPTSYEIPSTACTTPSSVVNSTRRSAPRAARRWALTSTALADRERVGDVDDQVGDDDEERAEQHGALDHRQVAVEDRVVGEPPDAGDVEHGLGQDRAAEQHADVEAEHGDDRRDRRAHPVAQDHRAARAGPSPARCGCSPRTSSRSGSRAAAARRSPRRSRPAPSRAGSAMRTIAPGWRSARVAARAGEDRETPMSLANRNRLTSPSQ